MKSVFDMNGVERAAALMVALGPDIASDILKNLDESSIESLTIEMAKIQNLNDKDREELIGEFLIDLRKNRSNLVAGEFKAKELLDDAFGKEKADVILKKVKTRDLHEQFDFLNDVPSDVIFSFIANENPQTIAVILQYIKKELAGAILKLFPSATATDIAIKIAKTQAIVPEAIIGIVEALKIKYEEYRKKTEGFLESGGINSLVNIMQHMKGEDESNIIKNFDIIDPELSGKIREKIFSFENILLLSNNEIRILIDEINNDFIFAKSLKGAGDNIRIKVLRNMSQNRATDVINEMNQMGAIKLSEVESARKEIVFAMRLLHENGVITILKEKEPMVE